MNLGVRFTARYARTEKEVILAELISELIPSMEVSRLVSSGTEAVMSAPDPAFTNKLSECP